MAAAGVETDAVTHVQSLLLRHSELLKGFIYTLIGRHADTDDVFQEVFLTATAKAADFTPGTDFLAWARAIARFKVLRLLADGKRRCYLDPEVIELLADEHEVATTTDSQDWERERTALRHCLTKIGPAGRSMLELRYMEGLAPQQIAQRLHRSVNGVSVALAKVRAAVRRCVERQGLRVRGRAS